MNTMNTFWLHRDHIYEPGLSIGFGVFSAGYLIWLLGPALFCYLTGRFYRSLDERGRDNMQKACGFVINLLEYLKITVLGLFEENMREFVPLHLCSAAGLQGKGIIISGGVLFLLKGNVIFRWPPKQVKNRGTHFTRSIRS